MTEERRRVLEQQQGLNFRPAGGLQHMEDYLPQFRYMLGGVDVIAAI
jgi:hypothetical protein